MVRRLLLKALAFLPLVSTQRVGSPEYHPRLITERCTKRHGCRPQKNLIVLDALAHDMTDVNTGESCYNSTGGFAEESCPTIQACARNCALQGVNYADNGVYTRGNAMTLRQYLTIDGNLTSVSPRVYLLDPSGRKYEKVQLLNQEFTFTVDGSNLPCGMNGALYLSDMDIDGGRSKLNPAGATYGTGYCDAQCYTLPWSNGVANIAERGICCQEMDIWEGNARATGYTPHACNTTGLYECTSEEECGLEDGICDKWGCGFNPYALGAEDFYGYHKKVNSKQPITVVTQFLTDDETPSGTMTEIRRLYIQHGRLIHNARVQYNNQTIDSLTENYCAASAPWYGERGGMAQMGDAIGRGMVLAMSIWNDQTGNMTWLDGGDSGPCNSTEGNPAFIERTSPGTSVTFSAIKWGDIGSTYKLRHR